MIYNGCLLKLADNSNVSYVKCFNMNIKLRSYIGSFFYVSIKVIKSKDRFNKGEVLKGVIVRKKKTICRLTGNFLNFDLNEIVLYSQKNEILSTRIFGLLPLELRKKKHLNFLLLSSCFI